MVKPLLIEDQGVLRGRLIEAMHQVDYKYLENHLEIIDSAIVFECKDEDDVAGYLWLYGSAEEIGVWVVHMLIFEDYRASFFTRDAATAFFGALYCLGCDIVRAENESQGLLLRIGGQRSGDNVDLKLPYTWR